jgi:hypothetical protein
MILDAAADPFKQKTRMDTMLLSICRGPLTTMYRTSSVRPQWRSGAASGRLFCALSN